MPSPRRLLTRAVAATLVSAWVLGLLPPAAGRDVPPTIVRIVGLDERLLAPASARLLSSEQGTIGLARPAWTRSVEVCSPVGFTMTGLVWRQSGYEAIPTRLSWTGESPGRARLVSEPDEGPDPGGPDDQGLTGTAPVWTGISRCLEASLRLPARERLTGIRAVFVDTSGAEPTLLERAGDLLAAAWGMTTGPFRAAEAEAMTLQPPIVTRSLWGADESMRRCGPDYAPAMKMAYVHHTVNSNDYTAEEADDLIRGIYAYHVKGRKYCDIAYNFLIDRFGRIYEGRYGGIDQPVIGAHAAGFNTGSAGVAALGTFTSKGPPRKVVSAYKRLLAWRLDVAHVRPAGSTTMVSGGGPTQKFDKGESVTLPVISGHLDTGLTSCPGRRLYDKLQKIRNGSEMRGLPKIWDPLATPNPAPAGTTQIQLAAKLSQEMDWTIDIYPSAAPTTAFKHFSGRGIDVLATWDRSGDDPLSPPAPAGVYQVIFRASEAGLTAREAVATLMLF
ncbi:MAG: peptidoglycan recognition protein family protein [Actinomycetota bacterium]